MSVIITGGLGHVGSWTARLLAEQGHHVVICDNLSAGLDQPHLDYLQPVQEQLTYEQLDILDDYRLFEIFVKHRDGLDGVIHCVSVIAGPAFQNASYRNISINTIGTLKIYETCRILGISRIVNLSSGAVYGDAPGPQHEDTPFKATDLYGATKISSEILGQQYSETYRMDVRQARLFFIYGPGKLPSRMHATYQALFGPLEGLHDVHAPAGLDQAVDWTHVVDAARGIVGLFEADTVSRRAFNLSSGVVCPSRTIMTEVTDLVGEDAGMTIGPGPFVHRGAPLDISAARDEFGFAPEYVDIRRGLDNYREWLMSTPALVAGE